MATFFLSIASVEQQIFRGISYKMQVMGTEGEMGIFPGHVPLLTCLKPGILSFFKECNSVEHMYLSGGILEIQRDFVTILADTVIRADELDAEQVALSKIKVERDLHNLRYDHRDYMKVSLEMSKVIAKIRLFELIKKL